MHMAQAHGKFFTLNIYLPIPTWMGPMLAPIVDKVMYKNSVPA